MVSLTHRTKSSVTAVLFNARWRFGAPDAAGRGYYSFLKISLLLIADARDFCMHESFAARCEPGSVVLMLSAVYGRMRLGRCIRGDYNVGCSTDVVAYFDAHCTGRQSCHVGVRNLIDIHPCQRDFTSYLEASYRCIQGICCQHQVLAISQTDTVCTSWQTGLSL